LKYRPLVLSLTVLALLTLLVSACSQVNEKPYSRIVATPGGDVQLINAFVTHDPTQLDKGELVPSFIPNNIKKIYLGIRFKNLGTDVDQFKVDYKMTYKGLEVQTEFDSQPTSWTEQSSGATVLILPIRRADKTPFTEGYYEATILIDQQEVAVLHYEIGGSED